MVLEQLGLKIASSGTTTAIATAATTIAATTAITTATAIASYSGVELYPKP